jgi:hypothetical protein
MINAAQPGTVRYAPIVSIHSSLSHLRSDPDQWWSEDIQTPTSRSPRS